jgi:hypothetical protein
MVMMLASLNAQIFYLQHREMMGSKVANFKSILPIHCTLA